MGCKYIGGLLLILTSETLAITSAEILQGILKAYNHPFVLTYFEISMLVAYLPLAFLTAWFKRITTCCSNLCFWAKKNNKVTAETTLLESHIEFEATTNDDHHHHQPMLTSKQVARLAFTIAPFWFITQYLWNIAVTRTSVSSATIIQSTSTLFTLWIGCFMGEESMNMVNIISVVISMTGVAMTALGQTSSKTNTYDVHLPITPTTIFKDGGHSYVGDILALLSALTDSIFTVILKRYAGEGERLDMQLLYGFIGLFTLSLWWLVWPLRALGLEPKFVFPEAADMKVIFGNSFVGAFLCDYFWGLGIAWTTPLVATIGSSLSIPMAMIEDMLIHGQHYSPLYVQGSLLVIAGFGVANVSKWLSTSSNCFNSQSLLI